MIRSFTSYHHGNRSLKYLLMVIICQLFVAGASAQHDSLILKNGDVIVGELKSMDKGVLTIETPYSKNDFTVEWDKLKKIYSKSYFLISLTDGQRFNGSFQSVGTKDTVQIHSADGGDVNVRMQNIVYLKGLKSDFWSRLTASIDVGLSLTKANNLHQLNMSTNATYLADKWQLNFYYNDLRSKQDSIALTRRTDFGPTFKYFLQNDWFLNTSLTFLSNTEQALNLRTTGKAGAGKYLVHTNKKYFGLGGGLSFNNESFTNETPGRSSLEGYAGFELNLFDLENLDLLSDLYVYPSLTESGRWRSDFSLDLKYDLPLDFYIKLGTSVNFDNRPAIKGNEFDYVTSFSIGWDFND